MSDKNGGTPDQTMQRSVPYVLNRAGKLVPMQQNTDGSLPSEITALPEVTIAALPFVPVPAHLFALSNKALSFLATEIVKVTVSYVTVSGGSYTANCVVTAGVANVVTSLVAAVATGNVFITSIMFSVSLGGDCLIYVGADAVFTLFQVPANKTVILTPGGLVTY